MFSRGAFYQLLKSGTDMYQVSIYTIFINILKLEFERIKININHMLLTPRGF